MSLWCSNVDLANLITGVPTLIPGTVNLLNQYSVSYYDHGDPESVPEVPFVYHP